MTTGRINQVTFVTSSETLNVRRDVYIFLYNTQHAKKATLPHSYNKPKFAQSWMKKHNKLLSLLFITSKPLLQKDDVITNNLFYGFSVHFLVYALTQRHSVKEPQNEGDKALEECN